MKALGLQLKTFQPEDGVKLPHQSSWCQPQSGSEIFESRKCWSLLSSQWCPSVLQKRADWRGDCLWGQRRWLSQVADLGYLHGWQILSMGLNPLAGFLLKSYWNELELCKSMFIQYSSVTPVHFNGTLAREFLHGTVHAVAKPLPGTNPPAQSNVDLCQWLSRCRSKLSHSTYGTGASPRVREQMLP